MCGGEKPWGRGKRKFCLKECAHTHTHITRSDYLGAMGRVTFCFAEKGDKEVIADWRIQGWTPHPQRRRRHIL